MKKEIIICDKCGREIPESEQCVQRVKDPHVNKMNDLQDVCMFCAYRRLDNYSWKGNKTSKIKEVLTTK